MTDITKTIETQDTHWRAFASIVDLNNTSKTKKYDIEAINDRIIKGVENIIKEEAQAEKEGKAFNKENMTDLFGRTIIYSKFKLQ